MIKVWNKIILLHKFYFYFIISTFVDKSKNGHMNEINLLNKSKNYLGAMNILDTSIAP